MAQLEPTPPTKFHFRLRVKVNGQVDERTGVAPVAAQLTVWTVYSNGGCGNSSSLGGTGPALTQSQLSACNNAMSSATTRSQCSALGVYSNCSTAAQYCGGGD